MSTQENTTNVVKAEEPTNTIIKPKIFTCFIYYSNDDDLSKIFEVINSFRASHNLKYTQQPGYFFFNLNQDAFPEFSKVRPFSVSKYQTNSEYSCSKDIADKILEKKNSFIKILWNEDTKSLNFFSRTLARIHNNLVYKIFKDAEIEFLKNSYKFTRNCGEMEPESEFKTRNNTTQKISPRGSKKTNKTEENSDNSGFVKVEKKIRKSKDNKENNNKKTFPVSYKDKLSNKK